MLVQSFFTEAFLLKFIKFSLVGFYIVALRLEVIS